VGRPTNILLFAKSILGINLYDWQARVLLNYASGDQTAAACCNNAGKTSTVFVVAALWMLYCYPKARIPYVSATHKQVKEQFFSNLFRFRYRPALSSWTWNEIEIRTPEGGFITGRSPESGGKVEGYHARPDSPVAILVDEAKSIEEDIFEALSRCNASHRLYASSTGSAFGFFYSLFASREKYWETFRIKSTDCPHVTAAEIEQDREIYGELSATFKIKHLSAFLYDAGDSMISLEHVRALLDNPPAFVPGQITAFCDFAGPGDQSVLAIREGNSARIIEAWTHRDTMHSVGNFIKHFKTLKLQGYQIGGDEGYGHQLMDRMDELDYHILRFNNGAKANQPTIFANWAAECWSIVGQLIERRLIIIPKDDKFIAQLTSRKKLYTSDGKQRLEAKADMRNRGLDSPDQAEAIIGAIILGQSQGWNAHMLSLVRMPKRNPFYVPPIRW
jgi:phage terminase large subunit